jgi:hypothetical protein
MALTGRMASPEETRILNELHRSEAEAFRQNPERGSGFLKVGATQVPEDLDVADLLAHTVVNSVIMNIDASVMKR